MHNLAVEDIRLALTEFGVKSGGFGTVPTRQARAAQILEETMRLVFGMPGTTGFNMWGFWEGEVWSGAPEGVLYNTDWSIRPAGVRWQMLMDEWSTNLDLVVGADGTIDFTGFCGDYEIVVGEHIISLSFEKAQSEYAALATWPGDANLDGRVHIADLSLLSLFAVTMLSSRTAAAAGQARASVLPPDASAFSLEGAQREAGRFEVVEVEDGPAAPVLQVTTHNAPPTEWDIQLTAATVLPIVEGDVLLAQFWIRCVESMTGEGFTTFVFELAQADFDKAAELRIGPTVVIAASGFCWSLVPGHWSS